MGRKQSEETRKKIADSIRSKHKSNDTYTPRCSKCHKFHNGRCR